MSDVGVVQLQKREVKCDHTAVPISEVRRPVFLPNTL